MGFVSGVIAGVAVSAAAAAWYLSKAGERYRDQYRVERRLGDLGDQLEARTRDIQASVNAQLSEIARQGRPRPARWMPLRPAPPRPQPTLEATSAVVDAAPTRRTRKAVPDA